MAKVLDVLRTEKKYPLAYPTARALSAQLSAVMALDPNMEGGEGYVVRSLYFDSFMDTDFYEKGAGLETRKKIRLRTYGKEGGPVKLEWKQKQNNVQRKRSLTVKREDAQELTRGKYRCLLRYPEPLAMEFYTLMSTQVYRPCCIVQYNRFAFVEQTCDTRVTLDSHVCAHEGQFDLFTSHRPLYPVTSNGRVILEVKYNRFLLSYIKDIISRHTPIQTASSKYCAARYFGLGGASL